MRLIIGTHVDDPRFEPFLPRVGCGICELRGKPINVQAQPDDNESVSDVELLERMASWSREHAKTHTEGEHKDHESLRRAIDRGADNIERLLEVFRSPAS